MREKQLPLDVIEIILSKLPIKDVLRCKAVSKSWHATILEPRFGRIHLDNARYDPDDDGNQLFMWPLRDTGIYHLSRCNGSEFEVISHLQCPVKNPRPSSYGFPVSSWNPTKEHPSPLCSCDGFFLIYHVVSKVCVLWNPITRSKVSFAYPETRINTSPDEETTTHGICYDSVEDDYKVVFVNREVRLYTVFSCRNDSWTEAKQFPHGRAISRDPGVSVGGVPYWVVFTDDDATGCCIVYFDAKVCGFKKLHRPADQVRQSDNLIHLTSLNGRLCLEDKYSTGWVLMQEEDNNANCWTRLKLVSPAERWTITKKLLVTGDYGGIHRSYLTQSCGPMTFFMLLDDKDGSLVETITKGTPSEVVAVRASLAVLPPPKAG